MAARVVQLVSATHVAHPPEDSGEPCRTIYGLYTFGGDLVAQWSEWDDLTTTGAQNGEDGAMTDDYSIELKNATGFKITGQWFEPQMGYQFHEEQGRPLLTMTPDGRITTHVPMTFYEIVAVLGGVRLWWL